MRWSCSESSLVSGVIFRVGRLKEELQFRWCSRHFLTVFSLIFYTRDRLATGGLLERSSLILYCIYIYIYIYI